MIGIYRIQFKDRVYIGSSLDILSRWATHKTSLRKGTHHAPFLQRVWTKHGEGEFVFSVLEECPVESLVGREQFYIDQVAPELLMNGLLVAGQGGRGVPKSLETRSKMSAGRMGISRPRTAKTKTKISATMKSKGYRMEKARAAWIGSDAQRQMLSGLQRDYHGRLLPRGIAHA